MLYVYLVRSKYKGGEEGGDGKVIKNYFHMPLIFFYKGFFFSIVIPVCVCMCVIHDDDIYSSKNGNPFID